MSYRTSPSDLTGMPPGIPHIIGNEAAERFSFYGMKAVLAVFMANYLHYMDAGVGTPMSQAEATEKVHLFNSAVYLTPFFGAFLADIFLGKYRTIILLSIVYCAGHAALAVMGHLGNSPWWLLTGLGLIAIGSGGIKPCVSAHVGDQFGAQNSRLLPRVFNWFYFSINIGAFISMLLTPWMLEWYGPHWAFGLPGVLMAIATFIFWLGRHRFIHVPPGGMKFVRELFSSHGILTLLKLIPLYLFVAVFWALFDQTGSTWIFQAQDMDLRFMGTTLLPSQIQSINSVFVLTFIPIFAYFVYPTISRVWKLTPLRKIAVGLFVMVSAFALVAKVQTWIDAGQSPNIGWQILAYALLTISEIMVSIVALEFAYTQAPKTMKSLVMCYYLGAVAVGNLLVAGINHYIQIPSAATEQFAAATKHLDPDWRKDPRNIILPGYDGESGNDDDFIARVKDGTLKEIEIPGRQAFDRAVVSLTTTDSGSSQGPSLPNTDDAAALLANSPEPVLDAWNNPILYERLNSTTARLRSAGPDGTLDTKWDLGLILHLTQPSEERTASWTDVFTPDSPWLERRKKELGVATLEDLSPDEPEIVATTFVGGQTKLQGAAYFHFFTKLMLGTAIAFVPFALLYRPKDILQD